MSSVKVTCVIDQYPDRAKPGGSGKSVTVESHAIWNDRVHITVEGKTVTLIGRDIITAVENAMRSGR